MAMSTVLIVDDHTLFREGLSRLFAHWDDFSVIGEASNGQEAIQKAIESLPDIVLMDINMPGINGIEATKRITHEAPACRVVILTMSDQDADLFEALKSGASGYILKNTPSNQLHDYLLGLMLGESPFSSEVAAKILNSFISPRAKRTDLEGTRMEPLTDRERLVLEMVVQGLSNTEIANKMFLSENTVKKYMQNILQKLHVNNRVEAAVYAVRRRLVP
jgi:DNA-binding NarL/FixJ family response regulator